MTELAEGFLLEDFISIYEVVADIRLAHREGRLASYLGLDSESASGIELARVIGSRLAAIIDSKMKLARNYGTKVQLGQQRVAIYAAVALIDEVFILEEQWSGQEAWLDELLEYRVFRSRVAGQRFFELAEQLLLRESTASALSELAAIFLLALRLGLQGQYRGPTGSEHLELLRQRLLERITPEDSAAKREDHEQHAFPQAYQFTVNGRENRLAPLKPWLRATALGGVAYLLLSSAIWLGIMQPFLNRHG